MNEIIKTRLVWQLFNKSFKKQVEIKFDKVFANKVMKRAKNKYLNIVRNAPSVGKH